MSTVRLNDEQDNCKQILKLGRR